MEATTEVEAVCCNGRTVLHRLRCEAPLLVRAVDGDDDRLHLMLVGGAAGPIGGDRLRLQLVVGDGAHVVVGSVAAQMAQPGPHGDRSRLDIEIEVGHDATLLWSPQPTISVGGSDHDTAVRLTAAASAGVTLREVVSLGRHGEPPGRLALRQRVTIGGEAVLDHETVFAPGALLGPGAQGPARTVTSLLTIDDVLPPSSSVVTASCVHATMHVASRCALSLTSEV